MSAPFPSHTRRLAAAVSTAAVLLSLSACGSAGGTAAPGPAAMADQEPVSHAGTEGQPDAGDRGGAQTGTPSPSGPAVDRGYERVSWRGLSFAVPPGGRVGQQGRIHPPEDGAAVRLRWPQSDNSLLVIQVREGVKLDPTLELGGLEGLYDGPCTGRQVLAEPVVVDGVRGTYAEFDCVPGSGFGPPDSEVEIEPGTPALWVFPSERVVMGGARGDATIRRVAESVRF